MKAFHVILILLSVLILLGVSGWFAYREEWIFPETEVVPYPASLTQVNPSESAPEGLSELWKSVLKQALPVADQGQPDGTEIPLQIRTVGGKFKGAYLLRVCSMMNREAYLKNVETNEWFRLSASDFEAFLSHEVFSDLPRKRLPDPKITLLGDWIELPLSALPRKQTICLMKPDGTFEEYSVDNSGADFDMPEPPVFRGEEIPERIAVSAQVKPDAWSLEILHDFTVITELTRVDESKLFLPAEGGTYTYKLTAHWDLSTHRDWYGEAEYEFHFTVLSQAEAHS